jgi:hypothetical protein
MQVHACSAHRRLRRLIPRTRSPILGHNLVLASAVAWIAIGIDSAGAQPPSPDELQAPFRVIDGIGVNAGSVIRFQEDAYRQLRSAPRIRLTQFPLEKNQTVDLELEQFSVTNGTTQFILGTPEGDVPMPHPEVALFRGKVVGETDSEVFLGVSPSGSNGIIRVGGREYVLAPDRGADRADAGLRHTGPEPAPKNVLGEGGISGTYPFRIAFVAIDCDYEFGQLFDNLTEATVYAIELLGAVSMIYERSLQVRLHIPYLRVWSTSNDPYTANDVGILLSDLSSHWYYNMGSVERDIVHLLSGEPGRAGLANVDVLCDEINGYGVSAGIMGSFPRPVPPDDSGRVDTFDIKIVAHEMGHQFGSSHTHCYSPPIDYCGRSFDDCWSGTFQCQVGCLMSYCDRVECVGAGGGKELVFHQRVAQRIRQSVDASCLQSGLDPVYVDWANLTGIENGSNFFPFNTVKEGVQSVIPRGTIHIDAGTYPDGFVANRPMVLRTTGGSVVVGP